MTELYLKDIIVDSFDTDFIDKYTYTSKKQDSILIELRRLNENLEKRK